MCHFTLISLAQLPLSLAQLPLLISMDASDPVGDIAADVLGDIPDLTVGEYKEMAGKSCFFRPGAVDPAMEASGFQCSLFEESAGEFYQEHNCKTLPILTVKHPCLFHSVDMYVCVALSIIVCVWYVIVSLPGRPL